MGYSVIELMSCTRKKNREQRTKLYKINVEYQFIDNQIKTVDLDFKSNGSLKPLKPLIKKCSKCGMILGSFVKKCRFFYYVSTNTKPTCRHFANTCLLFSLSKSDTKSTFRTWVGRRSD